MSLTEYAANESVLSNVRGDYLKNFGFEKELLEELKWNGKTRTTKDWLSEGTQKEDAGNYADIIMGTARFYNHFHNPLEPWSNWNNAGLDDYMSIPTPPFWIYQSYHLTGNSLLLWAQDDNNQNGFVEGDWTWNKIRDYYYNALTLILKSQREEYFARTFRGLGHQMHLVQDSAQPDHVRNDAHQWDSTGLSAEIGFEKWAYKNPVFVEDKASTASSYVPNVALDISYNGLVPISQFIDTEQYDGSMPSTTLSQGIAEYTNANFFSDDTIFAAEIFTQGDRHYFPYPKSSSTDMQLFLNGTKLPETVAAKDGGLDTGVWISKNSNGENISHFVRSRYLTRAIYNIVGEGDLFYRSFYRDEECHKDYAQELIPRAVGYSTALLNYFFRGEIDLVESGTRYKIKNLSDEAMEGDLNSYKVLYDNANDDRSEITLKFYDEFGAEITNPSTVLTIPAQSQSTFEIELQNPPLDPVRYVLVFRGKLGSENGAVIGKVIDKRVYFVVMPVDPVTRATSSRQFYYRHGNVMEPIAEGDLPFDLVDDGGYWNAATSDWTYNPDPESLKVPLSVGGPQYIAKYRDEANNRVRFVPNMSYEKNAYQAFHKTYFDEESQQTLADIDFVTFQGSPVLMFGAYQENPGYMEYMNNGLYAVRPVPAGDPGQRYFAEYFTTNFIDTFLEFDTARFYYFNGSLNEQVLPQDPEAPLTSVTAVSRSGSDFYIKVPKIFDYEKPSVHWPVQSMMDGSSGVDTYLANFGLTYYSTENKCVTDDYNCGIIFGWTPGSAVYDKGTSNEAEFDIPYNYNSWVHVVMTEADPPDYMTKAYYEELYINGQMVETSFCAVPADRLETHYEILAVYKNIAVVRETNLISYSETTIGYVYRPMATIIGSAIVNPDIYDMVNSFTSNYYIYINGARYDLSGQTSVESRLLGYYHRTIDDDTDDHSQPISYYLTAEVVEDITGYHIDRIFISDTFDGKYVLVAFDEYSYNNGAGLVHDINYVDTGLDTQTGHNKYFVYYDIPPEEIQGASHETLPVGRKLLLFKSDGTLIENLVDPVGLQDLIGSIGILN